MAAFTNQSRTHPPGVLSRSLVSAQSKSAWEGESDVAVVWVTNNKRMYTILLIMCMAFRSAARMSIRGRNLSGQTDQNFLDPRSIRLELGNEDISRHPNLSLYPLRTRDFQRETR